MSTVNQSIRLLMDTLRANKSCLEFLRDKEDTDLFAYWQRKIDDLTTAIRVLEEYERSIQ